MKERIASNSCNLRAVYTPACIIAKCVAGSSIHHGDVSTMQGKVTVNLWLVNICMMKLCDIGT
jgi:ABC-type glucose/galactose transport system permease subunit